MVSFIHEVLLKSDWVFLYLFLNLLKRDHSPFMIKYTYH